MIVPSFSSMLSLFFANFSSLDPSLWVFASLSVSRSLAQVPSETDAGKSRARSFSRVALSAVSEGCGGAAFLSHLSLSWGCTDGRRTTPRSITDALDAPNSAGGHSPSAAARVMAGAGVGVVAICDAFLGAL